MASATLESICQRISSGGTPSRKQSHYFTSAPAGHLWVKSKELLDQAIEETEERISDAGLDNSSAKYYPAHTVLVAMYGANVGQLGWLRQPATVNQAICGLVVDQTKADWRFVFYTLLLNRGDLTIQAQGAAQQNLNQDLIRQFRINLPPLPVQRRIAGILSAYDELIENSQRRIKILEAMARALYREALGAGARASPPIPIVDSPYWRFISENVSPYSGTKRYYATADIDGLAITGPGIEYAFAEKPSRAQKQPIANSVWFARMKDTYKIAWYGPVSDRRVSGTVLSSGFAGFEAADAELWPLLFLTISSKDFHVQKDLYCTGATQMSLTNEGLDRIAMPLPDAPAARRLGQAAGPMLNGMAALQQRNENLRRTRDLLLPRLLSGQIDVEAMP